MEIHYFKTKGNCLSEICDSKSFQVAGDVHPFYRTYGRSISQVQSANPGPSPVGTCKIHHKSLPDLHTNPSIANGTSSISTSDTR